MMKEEQIAAKKNVWRYFIGFILIDILNEFEFISP